MARAKIFLSSSALLNNYRILSKKVLGQNLLPMVKANAYGHDAIYTAKTLLSQKNLQGFGVASFQEGMELRKSIRSPGVPILVFSDSAPWTDEEMQLCRKYKLEPVFSEISSLKSFESKRHHSRIKAHVEVNTGMNRMGIPLDAFLGIRLKPTSVFTHLADADDPESPLTKKQMILFDSIIEATKLRYPSALLHFANSSAIWNSKFFSQTRKMDFCRPGLSLYGIRPFLKAQNEGLKRVMSFRAPVINQIHLKFGDQVGYGGTYTCNELKGEWLAVLAAGYADGLFRSLSSKGIAVQGRKQYELVGRVSMDLSAVRAGVKLKIGSELELWGDRIDPYVQASLAGTIPYELTTRMGERLERVYE